MNVRITLLGSLLLLLLCVDSKDARGQDEPVALDLDQAVFAYSDSTSLLELYFAFEAATLPFESTSAEYQASIPVTLELASEENLSTPVWRESLTLQFNVSDTAAMQSGQMFLHQLRASVPPGSYRLTLSQPEGVASHQSVSPIEREVVVEDFTGSDRPQFSGIALASRIHRSKDRQSPFYKNGLLIRPNPRLVYGRGLNRLYYYVELYNPAVIPEVEGEYQFHSYVTLIHQGNPVKDLQRTTNRKVRSPDVLVGRFDVSSLPSGSYELHAEVREENGTVAVSRSQKFFVYNPDVAPETVEGAGGREISARYTSMDEEMIEVALAAVGEIASDAERDDLQQLEDLEEKRRFLTQFLLRRDDTPGTAANEKENQFYRSLRLVRQQYDSPFKEAWETDRGRTMLQYGPPAQIDHHMHERETRPYVVWQYDHIPDEGQVIFVFIDRQGFGEFDLVHSTARGAVKNPDWRQLIQ